MKRGADRDIPRTTRTPTTADTGVPVQTNDQTTIPILDPRVNDVRATVDTKAKTVRLHGNNYGKPVDRTYQVGDHAIHGSYNISYWGTIVSITAKSVTIDRGDGYSQKRRMTLDSFTLYNREEPEAVIARDSTWMD